MTSCDQKIRFRTAVPNDHHWIVRSVDQWWGRAVSHAIPRLFLDHFYETSMIIEDGDKNVGFLVGFYSASETEIAYVHFVGIDPDYRRCGLAAELYTVFFERALEQSKSVVKAITAGSNDDSIAFHRQLGFTVSEPIEGYDRPGVTHIIFSKKLSEK